MSTITASRYPSSVAQSRYPGAVVAISLLRRQTPGLLGVLESSPDGSLQSNAFAVLCRRSNWTAQALHEAAACKRCDKAERISYGRFRLDRVGTKTPPTLNARFLVYKGRTIIQTNWNDETNLNKNGWC